MSTHIETHFDQFTATASHIVVDTASQQAAIVDPVMGFDQKSGTTDVTLITTMLLRVKEMGAQVKYVLETHAHADHLSSADYIRQQTGAEIVIGKPITQVQNTFASIFNETDVLACDGSQFDHLVEDGDQLSLGETLINVIATPGHTPACVSYLIGDEAVFVGDTLFMPDVGSARCDFPGGDARTLYRSAQRLLSLDAGLQMYLCHDYPPANRDIQTRVSVAQQRRENIHLRDGISEDEFVALRTERDNTLEVPRLILPSLQVNIRAGAFPVAEENGTSYLKMPLNVL